MSNRGKKLDTFEPDYVVFDLETTGISPSNDKIVEISAVKVKNHKVIDEFSTLVNPECHISEGASVVNGIYDDMVKDSPVIADVLPLFVEFIEDLPLAGHNIHSFDIKYIYRDCEKYLGMIPGNDYIDTLHISRKFLPEMAHHRLTDLAQHYGISTEGAHRALKDCYMTQQVYELLINESELVSSGAKTIPVCERCGKKMTLRNGKFGEFWGCTGYPGCNFTINVKK